MIRYLVYLLLAFLAKIFVWFTADFWSFVSLFTGPVLPGWLKLLHTADDDLDGGPRQVEGWFVPKTRFGLWRSRAKWMRRNPAWGFTAQVLGIKASDVARIEYHVGSPHTVFDYGNATRRATIHLKNGKTRWESRTDREWRKGRKFVKRWFGWNSEAKNGYHTLEFEFNPFMTVKGRP